MRALELVGFRPEHWGYDYPDCYAEFKKPLLSAAVHTDSERNSALLDGAVGTGKTVMLAILCESMYWRWVEKTFPISLVMPNLFAKKVKYCTHGELTASWENEFNENSDLPTENYFKMAPVLFLDDLFAGQVNQSGRNIAKLEELIDWRWSNHLKTFLATNISLKDLWKPANKQYHRIARRLSEEKWMYYRTLTHKFGGKK